MTLFKHTHAAAGFFQAWLKKYLGGLPQILQYIIVIGLVMLVLYLCLTLTRLLGRGKGNDVRYDDNDANDQNVPDLFASTMFRRKNKKEK